MFFTVQEQVWKGRAPPDSFAWIIALVGGFACYKASWLESNQTNTLILACGQLWVSEWIGGSFTFEIWLKQDDVKFINTDRYVRQNKFELHENQKAIYWICKGRCHNIWLHRGKKKTFLKVFFLNDITNELKYK